MPLRPLIALTLAAPCCAGSSFDNWRPHRDATIQDYGYQWATIGHARNADWVGRAPPFGPEVSVGGVNYRYRIAKTEVTNRQWFEFVQACAPFLTPGQAASFEFTGLQIGVTGGGGYVLNENHAEHGATVGWRYAARYVNWLHNNKVNAAWAFETGVYDVSTFGGGQGGNAITDQPERSQGARYFIPTLDEWIKAVHFDPHRYGEDQEGYWLYATTSDAAPVAGAPGTPGAQTNAGTLVSHPIMSYPDVQTPWGLWDASGSVGEWLETLSVEGASRLIEPTAGMFFTTVPYDHVGAWTGQNPQALVGIRLASIIPAPSTMLITLTALAPLTSRRRTMR